MTMILAFAFAVIALHPKVNALSADVFFYPGFSAL